MPGPLAGLKIIELGSIGPGPFCGMLLADAGATVIRIERRGAHVDPTDAMLRSRKILHLDLKSANDREALIDMLEDADGIFEGMRPGTLERLGLAPDILLAKNPRLVVGRMTGWGQTGPLSGAAGHDINYIALSGALHGIGPAEHPIPPLALVGDFGGGGMLLAFSMTAAILYARTSGKGQIIDCAMTEGSGQLMAAFYSYMASGLWRDTREANVVDGGAHFYGVYETRDRKFVSIGSIEPQFYALLLQTLGLENDERFMDQMDTSNWPELKNVLASIFKKKTQAEWCAIMENTDICFAPVLSMADAPSHPHARARGSFVEVEGIVHPAPAPKYSLTPLPPPRPARTI
ncbi:CaiB/BaiF CoA transferase family protein [Henriciella aquimarina]|uniref:CaiB/BaiF CoA transferase family protein n=1 Tax=Henriciella aquimarina TaxID=545261 RepID=UPI00117A952C|nr:CaiB/BaiF CoA-transferase family protein [Henriciella aquimarina]